MLTASGAATAGRCRIASIHSFADNAVLCRRIPLAAFDDFRARRPAAAEIIVRNLAQMLAHRLLQANTKIDLLSAN